MSKRVELIHVSTMPDFKPGDQPPEGYREWHEWARIQQKSGLRQRTCPKCSKWKFPQEFSDTKIAVTRGQTKAQIEAGAPKVCTQEAICNKCDKKDTTNDT